MSACVPNDQKERIYGAIKAAAAAANEDGPRVLADVAIRDGENWNDRRLPQMGRALNAALDEIDLLLAEVERLRGYCREWSALKGPLPDPEQQP